MHLFTIKIRSFLLSTAVMAALAGQTYAQDSDVTVLNSLTIRGTTGTYPTLFLNKDSSATAGFTLGYTEWSTSTTPIITTGIMVQSINTYPSQWQWQTTPESPTTQYPSQLQMTLDSNNVLTLYDLTAPMPNHIIVIDPHGNNPGITLYDPATGNASIVLSPGTTAGTSGIFFNGQQVATVGTGNLGFGLAGSGGLVVSSNGFVGIGTSNPAQQLTITGNFQLPATSYNNSVPSGVIFQDTPNVGPTPVFSTYTVGSAETGQYYNLFLGRNAGSFNLTESAACNVGIGDWALQQLTTGYNNTVIGAGAGQFITTGYGNSAFGVGALQSATFDDAETAVGAGALSQATDYSNQNTAVGSSALQSMALGGGNTAVGRNALFSSNFGSIFEGSNAALGAAAGFWNTTGQNNVFLGTLSGYSATTGSRNIFIGYGVGLSDPTASNSLNIGNLIYGTGLDGAGVNGGTNISSGNIGIGIVSPSEKLHVFGGRARFDGTNGTGTVVIDPTDGQILINNQPVATFPGGSSSFVPVVAVGQNNMGSALFTSLTTGSGDTSLGNNAMSSVNSGINDTAVGYAALQNLTTGAFDTGVGKGSLSSVTTGGSNVGVGNSTLGSITTDSNNTAVGDAALYSSTGSNNVAIGADAGWNPNSPIVANGNTYIGSGAGFYGASNLSNATAIGYNAQVTQSNTMIFGATGANAVNVGIGTTNPTATLHVSGNGNGQNNGIVGQFDGIVHVQPGGDIPMFNPGN